MEMSSFGKSLGSRTQLVAFIVRELQMKLERRQV